MLTEKFRYAFTFCLAWALLIFVTKKALNLGVEPMPFVIQSNLIALIILTVYIYSARYKEFKKIRLKDFISFFFIGIIETIGFLTDIFGLRSSTSINYSLLARSSFIFSIVLAYIFLKEGIHRKKLILMAVFIGGIYLVTAGGAKLLPKEGDFLIILSAFCYSSSAVVQKPLLKRISPIILSWARKLFPLLVYLLASFFIQIGTVKYSAFSLTFLPYILIAGILTLFTTVYVIKTLSVATLSYLTMMVTSVPVMTIILGTLFLGETINFYQFIGGVFIMGSIIAAQKERV